jgi:hypothetical protein
MVCYLSFTSENVQTYGCCEESRLLIGNHQIYQYDGSVIP